MSRNPEQRLTRILLIGNDAAWTDRLRACLREAVYSVDVLQPELEAPVSQDIASYALVLVNQKHPGENLRPILKVLASNPTPPPLLALICQGNESHAVTALQSGADDFLIKDQNGIYFELLPHVIARDLQVDELMRENRRAIVALQKDGVRHRTERERTEIALYQREQFQTLLNEITSTALETLNSPTMLKMLSERLPAALGADGCYFALWDEQTQRPYFPAAETGSVWRTPSDALLVEPDAAPLTKAALSVKCPVIVEDVLATPYISQPLATRLPAKSLLVLPLIAAEQRLGAVSLGFTESHLFTPEELERDEQVAQQIALAIAKARLFEETEQRYREAETLREASAAVAEILSLDETLNRILEQLERVVSFNSASIQLLRLREDEPGGYLEIVSARGYPEHMIIGHRLPVPGTYPHSQVVELSEPLVHERTSPGSLRAGVGDWLGVPLLVHDELIGLLVLDSAQSRHFGPHHVRLVVPFAQQAAIAIANARLVEALRERTAELEMRNEELDTFAHTVAHDLKGPLSSLVGYGGFLEENFMEISEEEIRRLLRTVAKSGRKLGNIVDELLLLTTVRKGEVKMQPLDMNEIVTEAKRRVKDMVEEYGAEIVIPSVWPVVLGHSSWVEEIWANYLSNAIKYGGFPPHVELGATLLRRRTAGGRVMVRFWCRDNGMGLTPEEQARLFTLFTRLDAIRVKGHGLGLSIVSRIAERLGGTVGVESEVGKGSTFWFTLPAP
ncbi:MAG: GAF domain-containing protein [Anaerolineae bacterium]|nr:GAF domain-containing protein [Anaerolineae bacterium]